MSYIHKVGSVYRFRRVVPEALRPFIRTSSGKPRTEFNLSLGTKERSEAKRKALLVATDVQRQLDEAEARLKAAGEQTFAHVPNRAMSLGEIDAMDAASAIEARLHFEWEKRAEGANRLID